MIRPLEERDLTPAVEVLASAYLGNPAHSVLFGGAGSRKMAFNRALFHGMVHSDLGKNLAGFFIDDRLVGVLNMNHSPACVLAGQEDQEAPQDMMQDLGEYGSRVAEFFGQWAKLDPKTPHWHLGPIAVIPEMQKQGIGVQLMNYYCRVCDEHKEAGYLETDRPENVGFYQKFRFHIIGEKEIMRVPCWFMRRDAVFYK